MAKSSFRAYPSDPPHGYYHGTRSAAFYADTVEWDTNGEYVVVSCSFTANAARTMFFHFNMLFASVPAGTYITPLLFLRKSGESAWKEIAGTDIVCGAWVGGVPINQGSCLSRLIQLHAGDSVQARPCFDGAANSLALTNAVSSDGIVTCNYFEGFEVG